MAVVVIATIVVVAPVAFVVVVIVFPIPVVISISVLGMGLSESQGAGRVVVAGVCVVCGSICNSFGIVVEQVIFAQFKCMCAGVTYGAMYSECAF